MRIEDAVASAVMQAWRAEAGDMLVFLPGAREIALVGERLAERLPDVPVLPLHGQVTPASQRAAIRRDPDGRRRIVLATSLAETSLTLDGVSVVVDSGLARQPVFDQTAGTTHLVTVRASQAAAAQRAGRAARQGPGVVYRLWEEAAHAGRPPFDSPEILTADLSPMLLALANWGNADPVSLAWLDQPPVAAVAAARASLEKLDAFDERGRITSIGRRMAALPLDPQSAAMVLFGATHGEALRAAQLALLLQERGLGGRETALEARLAKWVADRSPRAEASRQLAARWAKQAERLIGPPLESASDVPLGVILAAGRPEFVAKRRSSSGEQWLSAGGRGFILDTLDPLAKETFLVIGDAQGQAQGARISAAAALDEKVLHNWFADRIQEHPMLRWTGARVEPRVERRLGAIVLSSVSDPAPDEEAIAELLVEKAVDNFVEFLPEELLARARFARITPLDRAHLEATAGVWLKPLLQGCRDLAVLKSNMEPSLFGLLSWSERQHLESCAPASFVSPAGTHHRISYVGPDAPSVEVRVQAMFGLDRHPQIGSTPLLLKLTSPAGRPLQATRDLPGFWRGSWVDVRKEMKGRYPKHRWPEQPWAEAASLKTKNAFAAGQS
jgi:ATP-dependent helicase HrpB